MNQRASVLSHSDYSNNLGTDQRLHPVVYKHLGVFPTDDCIRDSSQIAPASDGVIFSDQPGCISVFLPHPANLLNNRMPRMSMKFDWTPCAVGNRTVNKLHRASKQIGVGYRLAQNATPM